MSTKERAIELLRACLNAVGFETDSTIELQKEIEDFLNGLPNTPFARTCEKFGDVPNWLTEETADEAYNLWQYGEGFIAGVKYIKKIAVANGEDSRTGGWGLVQSKKFLEIYEWEKLGRKNG